MPLGRGPLAESAPAGDRQANVSRSRWPSITRVDGPGGWHPGFEHERSLEQRTLLTIGYVYVHPLQLHSSDSVLFTRQALPGGLA